MGQETLGFDVQHWLEGAAQGYLLGSEHGHLPGESEPEALLRDAGLRESAIQTTVQLVVFERSALEVTSHLVGLAPDDPTRAFLATQVLDEARHMEVFRERLVDLGLPRAALEDEIEARTMPALRSLNGVLLERVSAGDFLAGFVGTNVFMEGLAGHVFSLLHAANAAVNPKFARTLEGVLSDEERHATYGERRIRPLLEEAADRKRDFERLRRDLEAPMLETFAAAVRAVPRGAARKRLRRELERGAGGVPVPPPIWRGRVLLDLEPDELERGLADAVLGDWSARLARLGLGGSSG